MTNATEYRNTMDSIRFTDTQKEELTAVLTRSAAPARRRISVLRPALIAAVVCLVLVGSALAVTVLHSAGKIDPFSRGDKKEELGVSNPGYTVTYEARRLPLSDFSDQILADAANLSSEWPLGFDSWDSAEEYIGFNLMDNSCLAQAEKIDSPYLLEGRARAHAIVARIDRDGTLTSARASASYCIVENGVPVRIDMEAIANTEAVPADVDISQLNVLYTEEETDLIFSDITGSNGLTVSVVADPDETYPTYYSAYFAANGVLFSVHVQYDWQNNTAPHSDANAAAAAVLQAVIDGFTF